MATEDDIVLENREQLKEHLSKTRYETTIIKLTASWCGPCKKIAPYVNQLNEIYSKTHSFQYIEIDVDNALDLYAFFKKMKMANGVPTFLTFKKCLYQPDSYYVPYKCMTGADPRGLEEFYRVSLTC
jgi:thiol-disulfide isomerase/thioredoxin